MSDPLECLLSAVAEISGPTGTENTSNTTKSSKKNPSLIHSGDTDSSDDEDNRDFENRKYNESGRNIKHLLDVTKPSTSSNPSHQTSWTNKQATKQETNKPKPQTKSDAMFGIRIINPLISSTVVEQRMIGREVVLFSQIKMFVRNVTSEKDWVIAGVVVYKTPVKASQNGKNYFMLTLSDLKIDLKTVNVLMFSSACKELWKTAVGTVVCILNPSVLDLREGAKEEACLSVNNHQRVMILGQSKDLGTCKSIKKNGERCTAFVNKSICEFCVYHVRQEYQKCSINRTDLQSSFAGRGLTALRNKVLGKDQVFYAGKLYTAIPASKSKKQTIKDTNRLGALSGLATNTKPPVKTKKQKQAARLDISAKERQRDLERLKKLGISSALNLDEGVVKFDAAPSRDVSAEDSKNLALDVINKLKKTTEAVKNSEFERAKFNAELSRDVTTEGSKSLALSVINKLKTNAEKKNKKGEGTEQTGKETNHGNNENLNVTTNENLEILGKDSQTLWEKQTPETTNKKTSIDNDQNKNGFNDENLGQLKTTDLKPSAKANNQTPKERATLTKPAEPVLNVPFLLGSKSSQIDLNAPLKPFKTKRAIRAKQNALNWIQSNGPIQKQDPNNVRGTDKGKKRALETLDNLSPNLMPEPKMLKIQENEFFSERFKKMMAATSNHTDLLEQRDNEEQDKYFQKLEMKERLEEKMLSTYKVPCKAVRCLVCKYTNFSASDLCKAERHPLKVFDAVKRFFKCGNCGNRTVTLAVVPMIACKNCGSGKWERTGMMKEKKVELATPKLSIRGGEQKFVNSVATDANLDLMMPDS